MNSIIEKAVERLRVEAGSEAWPDADVARVAASSGPEPVRAAGGAVNRIDFEELDRRGFLTPGSKRQTMAEEYRVIKLPVLARAFGRGGDRTVERGNMLMVSSSLPGEGKTYTALNLAMSVISERDTTVLLIDGDVIQRSLSTHLGFRDRPGLIDYLLDDTLDIGDVMLATDVPTFRFIPAGRRHEHTTELLAGPRMQRLVTQLAQRYEDRLIVIDSPPLLATTEAVVLSGLVGQVVLVVEEGKTPQSAVKDSIERIDRGKITGLVLNKNSHRFGSGHYGYYYGYSK